MIVFVGGGRLRAETVVGLYLRFKIELAMMFMVELVALEVL